MSTIPIGVSKDCKDIYYPVDEIILPNRYNGQEVAYFEGDCLQQCSANNTSIYISDLTIFGVDENVVGSDTVIRWRSNRRFNDNSSWDDVIFTNPEYSYQGDNSDAGTFQFAPNTSRPVQITRTLTTEEIDLPGSARTVNFQLWRQTSPGSYTLVQSIPISITTGTYEVTFDAIDVTAGEVYRLGLFGAAFTESNKRYRILRNDINFLSSVIPDSATDRDFDLPASGENRTITFNNTFNGNPPELCGTVDSVEIEIAVRALGGSPGDIIEVDIEAGTYQDTEQLTFDISLDAVLRFNIPAAELQQFVNGLEYTLTVPGLPYATNWFYGSTILRSSGVNLADEGDNTSLQIDCDSEACQISAFDEDGNLIYTTATVSCLQEDCEDCIKILNWQDCNDNTFALYIKDKSFFIDSIDSEIEEYINSQGLKESTQTTIDLNYQLILGYCCTSDFLAKSLLGRNVEYGGNNYLVSNIVLGEDDTTLTLNEYHERSCCC